MMWPLMIVFAVSVCWAGENDIEGYWEVVDRDSRIKGVIHIATEGQSLTGVGVKLYKGDWEPLNRLCDKCSAPYTGLPVFGLPLISLSKYSNGVWYDGMVQDPTAHQFMFPAQVSLDEPDVLMLRGYSMISFLGANVYWKRLSEEEAYKGCLHIYGSEKEVLQHMSESEALTLGNQAQLCFKDPSWS